PLCTISLHVIDGFRKQNTAIAIGKSIFDRSSKANVGELALKYGGGGHMNAGTCQVDNDKADAVVVELVSALNG
ncbi:MAG: exopolyphosphatase, partial [Cyanobacteria bacterium RYN_339]|nr:exopolyphosphatase [Cyanobacteria bacterium RYN_339]